MALIEGIGDDVITLLFILFTIVIIIISWFSTSVSEFVLPANLLVIERRSRRLYTTNGHGNVNQSNFEIKLHAVINEINLKNLRNTVNT